MGVLFFIYYKWARFERAMGVSGLYFEWVKMKNHVVTCDGIFKGVSV